MLRSKHILTLALAGLVTAASSSATRPTSEPDFTLRPENGRPITLSKLRGKVVVVNFFGVWCAPCKQELPWLEDFSKRYASKGVVVLGAVEESGSWTRVSPLKQKMGISYVWGMDSDDSFVKFKAEGLPSTVVIDRSGHARYLHEGMIDRAELDKAIQSAM